MINTTNLNEARKLIQKATSAAQPITVQAQDDIFNRKILEYGKFDILLFPDNSHRFDKLRTLDSGMNHIMAKIATKNKITIAYDLNAIRKLDNKQKAITLSRLKQNLKVFRKAKTKFRLLNVKDKKDAQSLLLSLGASTEQTQHATQ